MQRRPVGSQILDEGDLAWRQVVAAQEQAGARHVQPREMSRTHEAREAREARPQRDTVTRAKDELYLTYPVINHQARDGDIMMRPSRFITDLPKDLVEVWNVKSGW